MIRRLPRPRLPRRLDHGEEATLVEHLDELRTRLFFCLGALLIAVVVAFVFHTHIIHALTLRLPSDHRELTTLTPTEPFMTSLWVSLYAGLVLALPIFIWQTWSFFVPAVEASHAALMKWFVLMAVILAFTGIVFGYYIVLPAALNFLTNYNDQLYNVQIQARPYITFCVQVLVGMAIVWELPLFVVGLTRLGIVKTDKLRKTRRMGYFIVACVAVALPGVDPVTTTLETIPLMLLFEASIWLSVLLDRRSKRLKTAALET